MLATRSENLSQSLDGRSVAEFVGQWWVGIPKGNQEDAIIRWMEAKGIAYYRPMTIAGYDTHHRIGKPAVRLPKYRPLFQGYLCFCGGIQSRIDCRDSGRFASFIEILNQPKFVKQLSQVQIAARVNPMLSLGPIPPKGTRMRVKKGELMGFEGRFDCVGKPGKFCITLDAMSQAAELEIDASVLEPI